MKVITKTALGLLAVGLLAGCVYTPYPSGYYYPTYSTTTYPTYTRCYHYNYYPYTRCYYSNKTYYYSGRTYYYDDAWAW